MFFLVHFFSRNFNLQQELVSSNSVSNVTSDWQSLLWSHTELSSTRSVTIFNYLHGTLNFLGMYVNQNFNFKFYKEGGGGGVSFMLINKFTCLIPKAPWRNIESHAFHYWYFFITHLLSDIVTHMVKVLNSMTRSVCVTYIVFGLCILHDTNLVLSGSHH